MQAVKQWLADTVKGVQYVVKHLQADPVVLKGPVMAEDEDGNVRVLAPDAMVWVHED
jgi:hypothetical protein